MAKQPQKSLVILLERCDAAPPLTSVTATSVTVTSVNVTPRMPRSPRVKLVDCLSLPKSLVKVRRKSDRGVKRKKTGETVEEVVTTTCDGDLCRDPIDLCRADRDEVSQETSIPTICSATVEAGTTPPVSEDDQPPDSSDPDGKTEAPEQRFCAPERLSLFDQMPLLLLENDDFFPVPEDPLLADPVGLMLVSTEGMGTSSRNSSVLGEYPVAEFIHELNNDVMLGDVANRSALLEEEELLAPGGVVAIGTSAGEQVEFGQNDFAIDDEMDWSCEQPWPLLESGASLPEGHGLLNSSLEAGDSDDEFGQRMREEFLARRLRCSTRLQNQQSRRSADRSLSESDNLDSDSKIVIRKRARDVPNPDLPNPDIQEELFHKRPKARRIRSTSIDKVMVPIAPTSAEVELTDGKTQLTDGKTHVAELPVSSVSNDLIGYDTSQSDSKETDVLRQKKVNKKDRMSLEMKSKATQSTNSLLTSPSEVENTRERGDSFRTGPQSSEEQGKGARKLVDVSTEESVLVKKHSSRAKENKGVPERSSANDVTLSKSLLSSVEAARQKYLQMKKEKEANEPKESIAEEKAKKAAKEVKNPCRESSCSAPAQPGSIFCSSECVSRHVEESIKLLTQDRLKTYNRDQQPGISGHSDAAKATERVVVFERKTGKLVTGPLAPTESSLLTWLQRHPTFEVLQPEQATGHVSGSLKKRRTKLVHGGGRNSMEPSAVSRANMSGAPSDKTQRNSGKEMKPGAVGRTQAANARSDLISRNESHLGDKTQPGYLDPLRTNTRSELRHLLLERLGRDVSLARVRQLSVEIECELWNVSRGSTSLYKQKSSGLMRIFKRNSSQDLCRRLLCAEMKPKQLMQQLRELQRSGTTMVTKNNTVGPLDLLPGLTDTTDRHGEHIFDVGCRICSGKSTRTNELERSQPQTSSNTTCNDIKASCDLHAIPQLSTSARVEEVVASSGSKVKVGERVAREGERRASEETALTPLQSPLTVCVDSRHSNDGPSRSQDLPPSLGRTAVGVLSPGTSSDAPSSGVSPVILSPIAKTPGKPSIPVQKPSCSSPPPKHPSLLEIPLGFSSDVPVPPVEPPSDPPLPPDFPPSNVEQVPFTSSPALVRTSAPGTSLSTLGVSLKTQAPVTMRHSLVDGMLPSKSSAADGRPVLEGSVPGAVAVSRPHGGSNRTTPAVSSSVGPDVLVDMVWRGSVSALDGATMQLRAYRTSGSMKIVRSVLPATVTVMGRIDPKTVEDYLQKIRQQYTATREIAVICFHCHDDGDKAKYQQLFNYLQERRRCGVIGSIGSAIKDMYLWPLPSGASIPGVLLPFNGPGLDVNRSDVLLGIIIQQTRSRQKQTTPTAPLHGITVGAKGAAKVFMEPTPVAQVSSSQADHTPSSEIKGANVASPANGESSDEVSDDDLKALAQADPIVSKYSKARPQDLLVPAKIEDDKPYDPFDEDYEIGSTAQNPLKPVSNGSQKLTESMEHGKDISLKPSAPSKMSETTSDTDQTDRQPQNVLENEALQGAEESLNRDGNEMKLSKVDVEVCKQHERSDLISSRDDKIAVSSVSGQNNGNSESQPQETVEANQDVMSIVKTGEETKLKSVGHASKESLSKSAKASGIASLETDKATAQPAKPPIDESGMDRGGGNVDISLSAAGMATGQESSTAQSSEASCPDPANPETLKSIAMILTQLTEKNALSEEILRSLLDQLLSVYGAQNDREQRAILLQLVETIEKQQSATEKSEGVTEGKEGVTERKEGVIERNESVMEKQQSVTNEQEGVTEKQKQEGVTERKEGVMEMLQSVTKEQEVVTERNESGTKMQQSATKEQQSVTKKQRGVTKDQQSVTREQQSMAKEQQSAMKGQQSVAINENMANNQHCGLVCPEFNHGQNGMKIGRIDCDVVLKLPHTKESCVSTQPGHTQGSGKTNTDEATTNTCKDSMVEKGPFTESPYPAIYQTDIQSRLEKVPRAGSEGYDAGWFSPLHGREPGHGIRATEDRLEPWRHFQAEDQSAVPRKTGELRSCLKKSKPEKCSDEPGIDIEKILPVLSDSSFETIKSIVESVGIATGGDPATDLPSRGDVEDRRRPIMGENSLRILSDASFWSPPSVARPLASPPFPVRLSPERPLFSPTLPRPGRLPAPPKPPPCLLPGNRFRAPIPEAFGDPSHMPSALNWPQSRPGFQSPTGLERGNLCRAISPSDRNARLAFSPPWVPEGPSHPGHAPWGRGRPPRMSPHEAPVEDWSHPFNHPRQRCHPADTQAFWRSSNYDVPNSSHNYDQHMAAERASRVSNAITREDFSGKEMIEGNFDRYRNNGLRFPYVEMGPQQPLFPNDQDYRRPICDSGTKSLIDSTYSDRGFPENSYEFFGSIRADDSNFGGLGEILPGLGELLPGLGEHLPGLGENLPGLGEHLPGFWEPLAGLEGLDTTHVSEKGVDRCKYPSSQTGVNERAAEFEYLQGSERKAVITERNQIMASKTDLQAKTDAGNKYETVATIGSDLKSNVTDNLKLKIGDDDVRVKADSLACNTTGMASRMEPPAESDGVSRTTSDSNRDVDPETRCDQTWRVASQETVLGSEGVEREADSDHEEDEEEQDRMAETLARFNALIERCSKSKPELRSLEESVPLQEFATDNETPDEARLISDVSDLVKRCLDSDLISHAEICGGLGMCPPVVVETGALADNKSLPHVKTSGRESVDLTGESSSSLLSPRSDSPNIQPDASLVSAQRGKSGRSGSDSGGSNSDENSKSRTIDNDSNTATHINESADCVIEVFDDDSKPQWDVSCLEDQPQTVVDRENWTTESAPDRVIDSSRVSAEPCESVKSWVGESVKLQTRGRTFHDKSQPRTDSCDSVDIAIFRSNRHDSRNSSKGRARDSHSSCDSPEKRAYRHDSCEGSEERISHRKSSNGRQDSSESGRHSRRHGNSSGNAAKRKRSHESGGHARKRSRRDRDPDDDESDGLVFSSDESEQSDRVRRTGIYGRGSSYRNSESHSRRVREREARSPFAGDVDDRLRGRAHNKRFEDRREGRGTRPPEMSNGWSHHRGRRTEEIRSYGAGARSPSEGSDRTVTGGERRRDRSEGTSGSLDVDERTFRELLKEIELEERLEGEVERRSRRHQDGNGDRGERCRQKDQTGDPRLEMRSRKDAVGAKRKNTETFGLATFAGFISSRIPFPVESKTPGSGARALEGASGGRNLAVDTGVHLNLDRVMGPSVSRDGSGRQNERLVRSDNLVTDAVIGNHLTVGSTLGVIGSRKRLRSRDQTSSERKQMICSADLVAVNGCEGTGSGRETGHLVVSGMLLPNGQRTPVVQNLSTSSSHGPLAQNLRRSLQNPDSRRLSGPRQSHAPRRKHPLKVSANDELEEGEIVDAPNDGELPSATRDLLALLNAPITWGGPVAAISHVTRQQPGPSKT